MPEEYCQVLGFANPVLDSDYEGNDILEPKRSYSGVFNTFVNQWRAKKTKLYLSLHLGSILFPKFLKCWKLMHIKNSILNTNAKLKYQKLQYFGQTAKLKCLEIRKLLKKPRN